MKKSVRNLLSFIFLLITFAVSAADTTKIEINLDIKHAVGGKSEFDREKFIVLHDALNNKEWQGESKKRDYIFGDLDVYLGRDNGGINWWLGQIKEDPTRQGFADSTDIKNKGISNKSSWANSSDNKFDNKSDVMIGGQVHAIWPGQKTGWQWANNEAVGEYMAEYVNYFYRPLTDNNKAHGHPAPRFLEVLNEPEWGLHDDPNVPKSEKVDLIEIFRFHRDVARGFKKFNTTTKIGGYTVAFPEYDVDDFKRWNDRMKLFVDTAGNDMDFYSLHLYDFNRHWQTDYKHHIHFKGSRTEATLDMLEQYDMLTSGKIKPMVISEFGGRDLKLEQQNYNPERDWMTLKAINALTLQFMDRPDNIAKTVPFIMNKAAWSATPHSWRLQRQTGEPEIYRQNDYSTNYVFTELIKFYELWSDVKGTRVDAWSGNPDVKTDAYIDGNKVHLIFCNYTFNSQNIDINLFGNDENNIESIKVKHLYAINDLPTLETTNPVTLKNFNLAPEATAIVEYTFRNTLSINEMLDEKKYYATTYLQPIEANQVISFEINGVSANEFDLGQLRVSFGRKHDKSKMPVVTMNGAKLNVPENIFGEIQEYRPEGFFGMLEIPVPTDVLQENNRVKVTFPDDGGHISSVTLRVFGYSREISRSDSVKSISVYPGSVKTGVNQERIITAQIIPLNAADLRVKWVSSDENVVTVDSEGKITGKAVGTAIITATTLDGGFTANCAVTVQTERVPVEVDSVMVSPVSTELILNQTIQLNYEILPIDADDKTVLWSSENETIATVNTSGLVTAKTAGTVEIKATAKSGKYAASIITSKTKIPGVANFDDRNKYLNAIYSVGGNIDVTCNFTTTTGTVVDKDGIKFWLREIRPGWSVAKDFTATVYSVAGAASGTANAKISLEGAIPTSGLSPGNFYFLWISFNQEDGSQVVNSQNMYPINIVRPTAINEIALKNIEVYPNPAKNIVTILGGYNITNATFYNVTGNKVYSTKVNSNIIDISSISNGIYFVEIFDSKNRMVKKIIIRR